MVRISNDVSKIFLKIVILIFIIKLLRFGFHISVSREGALSLFLSFFHLSFFLSFFSSDITEKKSFFSVLMEFQPPLRSTMISAIWVNHPRTWRTQSGIIKQKRIKRTLKIRFRWTFFKHQILMTFQSFPHEFVVPFVPRNNEFVNLKLLVRLIKSNLNLPGKGNHDHQVQHEICCP